MFVRFVKYPGESQWAQYVEAAHQGGAEERLRPLHVPGGCFHLKHNIAWHFYFIRHCLTLLLHVTAIYMGVVHISLQNVLPCSSNVCLDGTCVQWLLLYVSNYSLCRGPLFVSFFATNNLSLVECVNLYHRDQLRAIVL